MKDLNDPFKGSALGLIPDPSWEVVNVSIALRAYNNRLSANYAILSLTRNPLNPLMWSHYGDSYKGLVIGIDTEKAGFEDKDEFIIPAHQGEIIYVKTMPKNVHQADEHALMAIGTANERKYPTLLKHGFLYKMQEWAYEEEVRVVKNIRSANFSYYSNDKKQVQMDNRVWTQIRLGTRPIYLAALPKEAFVEVYVGSSARIDQKRKQENKRGNNQPYTDIVEDYEALKSHCHDHQLPLYRVDCDKENLALNKRLIPVSKD